VAHAAVFYAKKQKKNMLIIPGNSYGHKVYHIAPEGSDVSKYTVMSPKKGQAFQIMLAKPDGNIFYADWIGESMLRRRTYMIEVRDPKKMTEVQFWKAIDKANPDRYTTSNVIDWGGRRGQGKRMGRMIRGAMSDAPQGKKSYISIIGKLKGKLSRNDWEEAMNLEQDQKFLFAKALAAGFSVDVAFLAAYTTGKSPVSKKEAYKLATEK